MLPERLVFVDLETAGLEPWRPVMQIAAVAVSRDLRELEAFEAKIRFSHSLADPKSLRKPSYQPRLWERQGVSAREAAEQFAEFLRRHATVKMKSFDGTRYRVAQLVAHNATHDGGFLRHWFDRLGLFLPGHYRMLCTVQRAIWFFQESPEKKPPANFKLLTLCHYFGVRFDEQDAHDALNDVRATVALYRAMTRSRSAPKPHRKPTGFNAPLRQQNWKRDHSRTSLRQRKPNASTWNWIRPRPA